MNYMHMILLNYLWFTINLIASCHHARGSKRTDPKYEIAHSVSTQAKLEYGDLS